MAADVLVMIGSIAPSSEIRQTKTPERPTIYSGLNSEILIHKAQAFKVRTT